MYMLQDRPTPEENELIFRLKLAVSQFKECSDFFDVYDAIDIEEEGGEYHRSQCQSNYHSGKCYLIQHSCACCLQGKASI